MSRDLSILYHSASPWVPTGYGRVTQELLPRLHNVGYDVSLQSMNAIRSAPIQWHGEIWESGEWTTPVEIDEPITIYSADSQFGLNEVQQSFEHSDADILFTHFDSWMNPAREIIPNLNEPYISYVIVDHYPAPEAVVDQVNAAYETVSMSKFAKTTLEKKGTLSTYIPHGVNTDVYKPLENEDLIPEKIEVGTSDGDGKRDVQLEDTFVIGMVAANMGDRKNLPNHMEAYKMFLNWIDNPDDILMYIHTDINANNGYDLYDIQKEIGIPEDKLIWGHPEDYGEIGDETLNKWYNAFDVLVNCTYGESWGLAITESMSAGTPVIASMYSSMPEQLGVKNPFKLHNDVEMADFSGNRHTAESSTGSRDLDNWSVAGPGNVYEAPHGILIQPSVPVWRSRVSSKLYVVHPHDIFQAMKFYYENPELREEHSTLAREHVLNNYTWDEHVLPAFDDMFQRMETILT